MVFLIRKIKYEENPPRESLRTIEGVSKTISKVPTEKIDLQIFAEEGPIKITAVSITQLCAPVPKITQPYLQARWQHLADSPLTDTGGKVNILLRLNYAHLMLAQEVRDGKNPEQLFNIKPKMGWIVQGTLNAGLSRQARVNLVQQDQQLDQLFQRIRILIANWSLGNTANESAGWWITGWWF